MSHIGWVAFGSDNFKFVEEPLDWESARAACAAIDGSLASIHNNEENDFVFNQATSPTYWLGGKVSPSLVSSWVDETPFDFDNFQPGQPNPNNKETCIRIGTVANLVDTWNDGNKVL